MAKVKIQGNASGTGVVTVTAPNTSTDRTITLPDATGTLATTADNGSQLDHSGSKKIEATATGVDVTGIAVTDGITSSGNITFDNGNSSVSIKSDGAGATGSYIQYGTDEYLRFLYDNGAGETMRLHDSGYVTMPQGVTLGNGNTYAAANTLDDYEEGSFTPTFTNSGTLSHRTAKYTKIGQTVIFNGEFRCTSFNNSGSTAIRIGGLPFTSQNTSSLYGAVTLNLLNGWNQPNDWGVMGWVDPNGTEIALYGMNQSSGANYDIVTASHFGSGIMEVQFSGTYITDS